MYTPFFQSSTTTQDWVSKPPKKFQVTFAMEQYFLARDGERYYNFEMNQGAILYWITLAYRNQGDTDWKDILTGETIDSSNIVNDQNQGTNYNHNIRNISTENGPHQSFLFDIPQQVYDSMNPKGLQFKFCCIMTPSLEWSANLKVKNDSGEYVIKKYKFKKFEANGDNEVSRSFENIKYNYFFANTFTNQDIENLAIYQESYFINNSALKTLYDHSLYEDYGSELEYLKGQEQIQFLPLYGPNYEQINTNLDYINFGYEYAFDHYGVTEINNAKGVIEITRNKIKVPSTHFPVIQNSVSKGGDTLNMLIFIELYREEVTE